MTEFELERYELAKERILEILGDANKDTNKKTNTETVSKVESETVEHLPSPWREYFHIQSELLMQVTAINEEIAIWNQQEKHIKDREEERNKRKSKYIFWNELLYRDILPENYETSFTNPDFATQQFAKQPLGAFMAAVAAEMRTTIPYAYEQRAGEILLRMELLLELYTSVKDAFVEYGEAPSYDVLRDILYWYVSDYSEPESLERVKEMVDPSLDFAYGIIVESDLDSTDYLYQYGEYITENEKKLSSYLASLPEEKIAMLADTFTEGYRIGFVNTGKDLTKKTTVNIRYPLGFERIVRQAIRNFELLGLRCVIYRGGNTLFRRQGTSKVGFFGANPNKQYDYDHKEDEACIYDGQFITRKLECLKAAFEEYKELANGHAGPAVMEVFGEQPFSPVVKKNAFALSEQQQKLSVKYALNAGQITNEYIKGEERSFTIIAFPCPEIGQDFEAIFEDTIKINTLDYMKYQRIQQTIIDALDEAQKVHVVGKGDNHTDLYVSMHGLSDAKHQTQFENCVADVNIPVGEVFTSPKLEGTTGILQVSKVYLNELEYRKLSITLEDGMVTDYSCENFDTPEENRKYIKDNVLYHHDTLPVGEFAIGTNTSAYVMARRYGIEAQLPILIAEKTGPHFALGDTCYSHAEDVKVYNPDGKEIISRDNSISILRKTQPDKAYFNCHTDITIPYDELALIVAICEDGSEIKIIEDGRFVLAGTEELNDAFS